MSLHAKQSEVDENNVSVDIVNERKRSNTSWISCASVHLQFGSCLCCCCCCNSLLSLFQNYLVTCRLIRIQWTYSFSFLSIIQREHLTFCSFRQIHDTLTVSIQLLAYLMFRSSLEFNLVTCCCFAVFTNSIYLRLSITSLSEINILFSTSQANEHVSGCLCVWRSESLGNY